VREKELKAWRRSKKNDLVNTLNPEWLDLSADWYSIADPSLRSG
jgi:putative endonuclease